MAWRTYGFDVNGLPVAAWYREETVEQVLAPLLTRLARSHQEKGSQAHLGNPVRIRYCDRDGHVSRTDIVRGGRRAAKCRLASIVGKGAAGDTMESTDRTAPPRLRRERRRCARKLLRACRAKRQIGAP